MRHHRELKAILPLSARRCCQKIVTPATHGPELTPTGAVERCDTIELGRPAYFNGQYGISGAQIPLIRGE